MARKVLLEEVITDQRCAGRNEPRDHLSESFPGRGYSRIKAPRRKGPLVH